MFPAQGPTGFKRGNTHTALFEGCKLRAKFLAQNPYKWPRFNSVHTLFLDQEVSGLSTERQVYPEEVFLYSHLVFIFFFLQPTTAHTLEAPVLLFVLKFCLLRKKRKRKKKKAQQVFFFFLIKTNKKSDLLFIFCTYCIRKAAAIQEQKPCREKSCKS